MRPSPAHLLLAATLLTAGCNRTAEAPVSTTDTTTNLENEDPINQTIPGATETNQSTSR